jgi:hypothetical protein
MKRCPKCSRTFPDDNQKFCTIDGGLLVAGDKPFDPNATIQSTSLPVQPPPPQPPKANEPDFGATIATSSSAPTAVLPKKTGPTGSVTAANVHQQQQQPPAPVPPALAPTVTLPPTPSAPLPPTPATPLPPTPPAPPTLSAPLPPTPSGPLPGVAGAPPKKSKLPLILGILAILFILGAGAVVAAFFLIIKPRLDQPKGEPPVVTRETPVENVNNNSETNANTNTKETKPESTEFVAPPDTTKFTNSQANLDGKLAEHYFDFSFYYPNSWQPDPKAGGPGSNNFAKVERRLPPDFTQENFAVGWYKSTGTFAGDESSFPQIAEGLSANLAKNLPEYRKVSEGPTKVNSLAGYEFRFESVSKGSEKGDIQLWGRVIFLPTGVSGETAGATLVMLTTSLAPELSGVDDVGARGQMPVILESFRFGKK